MDDSASEGSSPAAQRSLLLGPRPIPGLDLRPLLGIRDSLASRLHFGRRHAGRPLQSSDRDGDSTADHRIPKMVVVAPDALSPLVERPSAHGHGRRHLARAMLREELVRRALVAEGSQVTPHTGRLLNTLRCVGRVSDRCAQGLGSPAVRATNDNRFPFAAGSPPGYAQRRG